MERGAPDARIVDSSSKGDGKSAGGEHGQELIEFALRDMASCDGNELATAAWG